MLMETPYDCVADLNKTIQAQRTKAGTRICRTCRRKYVQIAKPRRRGDAGRCPRCVHRKKQQRMPRGRFCNYRGEGFLTHADHSRGSGAGFLTYF